MDCELHNDFKADFLRIRDDIAELYSKANTHEARLATLNERDKTREDSVLKLEAVVEKGMAKLEGLIQALSSQVTMLQNAPSRKVAARWDDIVKTLINWAVVGAIGFAISYLVRK